MISDKLLKLEFCIHETSLIILYWVKSKQTVGMKNAQHVSGILDVRLVNGSDNKIDDDKSYSLH